MISLQFKNTKNFMALFLASDTFDSFLLESAELHVSNTYTIDGRINKEFYGDEKEDLKYDLTEWSKLRSTCFDLIKGKHTPLSFKFVLCATPEKKEELLSGEDFSMVRPMVSSLVYILNFKEGHVTLTTGAALSGFFLDKSYEKVWDDYIRKFISSIGLEYEENA